MSVESLKRRLDSLESPFSWDIPPTDIPIDQFLLTQSEKRDNVKKEAEADNIEFYWKKYILDIFLAYETYNTEKDAGKALGFAESCVEHLEEAVKRKCQQQLFLDTKNALIHVALTTKCHLLMALDHQEEDIITITERITPQDKMNCSEKAAIHATKADVHLVYGNPGHKEALQNLKVAVNLNPTQAQWNFLLGKAMGRLRRVEGSKITDEELAAIEKANRLDVNPAYIVHKALLYSELSGYFFFKFDRINIEENQKKSRHYAKIAVDTFKKAVELRPNNPSIKARAAHGLLRIKPAPIQEMKKYVKGLLDYVVEVEPNNPLYYHDLGYYFDKFENNPEKALECLTKANSQGNNKALVYLLALKWRSGYKKEILEDLEKGLNQYKRDEAKAMLLSHMVVYTLLIKDDWKAALAHANQSLQLDPSGKYLVDYLSLKKGRVNLILMMKSKLCNNRPRNVSEEEYDKFISLSMGVNQSTCSHKEYGTWKRDQIQTENTYRGRFR